MKLQLQPGAVVALAVALVALCSLLFLAGWRTARSSDETGSARESGTAAGAEQESPQSPDTATSEEAAGQQGSPGAGESALLSSKDAAQKQQDASAKEKTGFALPPTIWELEVGAFLDETKALEQVQELAELGYEAKVVTVRPSLGGNLRSVRIGEFTSRQAGVEAASALRLGEGLEPVLRSRRKPPGNGEEISPPKATTVQPTASPGSTVAPEEQPATPPLPETNVSGQPSENESPAPDAETDDGSLAS